MSKRLCSILVVAAFTTINAAKPEVNFNGYLDADVWADLTGKYYINSELDLGMGLEFNENVSANVYLTANSANNDSVPGRIPAGTGASSERWVNIKFDGFDLSYASPIGTFSVGDLTYQYGKFNYYFYKRLSMITSESCTRGIKYSVGNSKITQEVSGGISDKDENTADVHGLTNLTLSENQSIGVSYGIQNNSSINFKTGSKFFAGAEYLGKFGDVLSVKADIGYTNLPGDERQNLLTFLMEPSLSLGNFTTAMTVYAMVDPDSANDVINNPIFGLGDEFFCYMEPGYSFNKVLAAGLPLEIHGADLENDDDNSFWAVPTFYVYPTANVQWWIWGQVVVPIVDNVTKDDLAYGIGSEIIVSF